MDGLRALRWLLVFLFFSITACDRGDGISVQKVINVDKPDSYARFINPVNSLAVGDYTVVAATFTTAQAGSFTLTITYDDGSIEEFTGTWTASGGMSETDPGNPAFNFELQRAGGIQISLVSTIDTYLYLLDYKGAIVAENNDVSIGVTDSLITLAASRIDNEAFGAAYYATIDPLSVKDTLEKWKLANGFYAAQTAGKVTQARFRDTKDLGYGRGVRTWGTPDGSLYFFVENFQVRTVPGLSYTALNLDALILDQRQHHFGSNAIEFSTYPYGLNEPCEFGAPDPCATSNPNPPKFAKFFTFDATQGDQTMPDHANETRLNRVDLDGHGLKAMPNACVYCHGGTVRTLVDSDGSYRDYLRNDIKGDVNAKLHVMEVPTFEFWSESPWTQAEQEASIKRINQMIYCTYTNTTTPSFCSLYCVDPADPANCDGPASGTAMPQSPAPVDGNWTGDFIREMLDGWYDDPATPGTFDSAVFRTGFVPSGWQPNVSTGSPPAGSDQLFLEVVGKHCIVCHARRGTEIGPDFDTPDIDKEIDFSSYDKFINYADRIESYVYDRGIMPLSLRGYNAFWADDSLSPELLGSFLPGFSHGNADGTVDEPGDPVADAGPDRTTPSPVRMFGSNSLFNDTFDWSIVSTPVGGETATLNDNTLANPGLTVPMDGQYVLMLTVSYKNKSDSDLVTIDVDSTLFVNPKDIVFEGPLCTAVENCIKLVMQNTVGTGGADCVSCHIAGGGSSLFTGIPMYWTDAQPGTSLYEEVLTRVNFSDPENSLVLRKPSGETHFGGKRGGFDQDNPSDRQFYDMFLNWIMEGARRD